MRSSYSSRSCLVARRAGVVLMFSLVGALTGCGGEAGDELGLDVVDEEALLEGGEPGTAPLEASEPGASEEADSLGQAQEALLGSNTCQDAYIAVRNLLSDPITVRSIEYYNGTETRWQTEDLPNRTLAANTGLEIWVQDLERTKNDVVYSANLLYDHLSHTHDEHFNIPDTTCVDGIILFDLFVE